MLAGPNRATMRAVPTVTISYSIPYTCQFATPDLVWEFINQERDLATDPRWAEYGAETAAENAHWALPS